MSNDRYYAAMADRLEYRESGIDKHRSDLVASEGAYGRAWLKWRRFNPNGELVYVVDIDGRDRALTRKQADVLDLALTFVDRGTVTVRALAAELKCAPSTVSRALARLASFGLLAYLGGRGRYAGMVIFRRVKGDPFKRFQDEARARLARYRKTAEDRISRLAVNVASMYSMRRESHKYMTLTQVHVSNGRAQHWTLEAPQTWSPEELRDLGII
jgi:hypothetical protein